MQNFKNAFFEPSIRISIGLRWRRTLVQNMFIGLLLCSRLRRKICEDREYGNNQLYFASLMFYKKLVKNQTAVKIAAKLLRRRKIT